MRLYVFQQHLEDKCRFLATKDEIESVKLALDFAAKKYEVEN